jgi:beta-lactamase class A
MKRFFVIGTIFGFGVAAIILPFFLRLQKVNKTAVTIEEGFETYPLLAKRIFVGSPNDMIIYFVDLREKLKTYIAGTGEKIGLYFEYLPTGIHIGINDREEFYRASLVKVPLIMQLYKMMEDGYIKKDEQLVIRRDLLDDTYGELWKTGAGTSRSVEELVRLVLTESDNTAYSVLLDKVNQVLYETDPKNEKGIDKIYDFLDIPREDKEKTLQISPRSYASILKALFFSSYLNYSSSNEILDILSQSKFREWMPKDLPPDVKVAHKVGIFQGTSPDKSVNSDCGIVYIPNRPFILCVMIKSGDTDESVPYINDITKIIYEYLVKANNLR